jgi:hypothetical protein
MSFPLAWSVAECISAAWHITRIFQTLGKGKTDPEVIVRIFGFITTILEIRRICNRRVVICSLHETRRFFPVSKEPASLFFDSEIVKKLEQTDIRK